MRLEDLRSTFKAIIDAMANRLSHIEAISVERAQALLAKLSTERHHAADAMASLAAHINAEELQRFAEVVSSELHNKAAHAAEDFATMKANLQSSNVAVPRMRLPGSQHTPTYHA